MLNNNLVKLVKKCTRHETNNKPYNKFHQKNINYKYHVLEIPKNNNNQFSPAEELPPTGLDSSMTCKLLNIFSCI